VGATTGPRFFAAGTAVLTALLLFPGPAGAQQLGLISRAAAPSQGAGGQAWTLSDDGRFFAFTSSAPNLFVGQVDTNGTDDVFLYDRSTASVTLVSHLPASSLTSATGRSSLPRISGDGEWVVFDSQAPDLASGTDTNDDDDVFLYERATGAVRLVSHVASSALNAGNAISWNSVVSADGSYVAFQSRATDLLPVSDGNGDNDIFLYERSTGTLTLVSHAVSSSTTTGNANSFAASISGTADFVIFISRATNLITGTFAPFDNVFAYERSTGVVSLLSHAAGLPTSGGNGHSSVAAASRDGNYVVFASDASDLVAGQSGGAFTNIFSCERAGASITLASHAFSSGVKGGDGSSYAPLISADGQEVVFESVASDLLGRPDTNQAMDVFLYHRVTSAVSLVTHVPGSPTTTGNGDSFVSNLSLDGAFVAFSSQAIDLVPATDNNNDLDAFFYEEATGVVTLASHAAGLPTTTGNARSIPCALAADASFLAFESSASDLVPGPDGGDSLADAFLQERTSGTTAIVSHPATSSATANGPSSGPRRSAVSDDGRFVVFTSGATNLIAGQVDTNGGDDVFLYDDLAGTLSLVSHVPASSTTTGIEGAGKPAISPDGSYVAFSSRAADLVPGPGSGSPEALTKVFLYERVTGTVTLVSHTPASMTTPANDRSDYPSLSENGAFVAFQSAATDLVPGTDVSNTWDIFVYDRVSGNVALASHLPGSATAAAASTSLQPAISKSGDYVVFASTSPSLANGTDTNGTYDVFLYERLSGVVLLVSHVPGSPTTAGNNLSGGPQQQEISADGSKVAFVSFATNLVTGTDGNGDQDVFLYRRAAAEVSLVSHAAGNSTASGDGYSTTPSLSADGAWVAFASDATDLVAGMSSLGLNAFVYQVTSGTESMLSHLPGAPTSGANGDSWLPVVDGAGAHVVFVSRATDLINGLDSNGTYDVFAYDPVTDMNSLVSHVPWSPTTTGNAASGADDLFPDHGFFAISANGSVVAFDSKASDLISSDFNLERDVFLYRVEPVPVNLQGLSVED
jgi:Tol biopolymer transport system component